MPVGGDDRSAPPGPDPGRGGDHRVTVWVLGDQLHRRHGALAGAHPRTHRVLLVESEAQLHARRWHRQRLHVVLSSMRHFAAALAAEGFAVDHRRAPGLAAGLAAHRAAHRPREVLASEPCSWDARRALRRLGVRVVRNDQFLCHPDEFAAWAAGRPRLRMEDFYRWQRRRLGYLMDGDRPAGGRWNHDAENRRPPPRDGRPWPEPVRDPLDDLDRAVLADLGGTGWGAPPDGLWPTSREAARRRLDHAIGVVLPRFGPHQDAMLTGSWQMAHTLLSPALNLGWLHPREVCDAIEDAYRAGAVPVASAEGLLRQVLGWREYVWGLYWLWMPGWRDANELGASRPLPPAFTGAAPTRMACLAEALEGVRARAWVHHIQRLMVLGNLCLLAGVRPAELVEWMWASFVDGAEWVMLPNVVGMALYADGGRMATKPYASGGAYLNRMGDACGRCPYDPRRRTGPDACPYTTLYWDFLARHAGRLAAEPRVAPQVRAAPARPDLPAIRARAAEVLDLLDTGEL